MILTKMSLARTTISKRYCANGVVNLVYRPASLLSLSSSCQQSTPPRRFHSGERKTDDDNNNLSPAENLRLLLKEYNISMDNTRLVKNGCVKSFIDNIHCLCSNIPVFVFIYFVLLSCFLTDFRTN